ncbi:hypothetical protein E3A20_20500 [Planctomyces bekefii]|uniref:Uncharacterized protein n=1 Tax=Planctomyces bekefii TaxID=1653850 RepID=A0A5C6M246_9PLAN|nr:hypothetical protein E3A20_20500 [Planctomyces bekefii]
MLELVCFWAGEAPAEPWSWTEKIGNVCSGVCGGFECSQSGQDNSGLIFGRPKVAVATIFQEYQ